MAAGLTEVLWVSEERSGLHVKFQDRQGFHQAATSDLLIRTQESASCPLQHQKWVWSSPLPSQSVVSGLIYRQEKTPFM